MIKAPVGRRALLLCSCSLLAISVVRAQSDDGVLARALICVHPAPLESIFQGMPSPIMADIICKLHASRVNRLRVVVREPET